MHSTSNPYAAPPASATTAEDEALRAGRPRVEFGPILRRWERLRIYYNGLLISLVLLISFLVVPQHVDKLGYWVAIVFGGVIANLCFLTGPAIEGYGRHFRLWNGILTAMLFLVGLGLSAALAIGCIAMFPNR